MIRLYVDEVGTDDRLHVEKDKHRFLSLTGVAMDTRHAGDHLIPAMNAIKADLFNHDPDSPLVFHRTDIMGGKGPFQRIREDGDFRAEFDNRIISLMNDAEYTVITALIDKQWMLRQDHWLKTHPYHYLMEIMVEKYAQFLERAGTIGDIMPEARRGNKDNLLQQAFDTVMRNGTDFVSSNRMNSAIRSRNLKFRTKKDKICGLELCDLLAHPSHINTRRRMNHDVNPGPFATQVIEVLERAKYDRSYNGKIIGYGIKHLPQ